MPSVTFLPLGERIECKAGQTVFEVATHAKVPIPTACQGKGTCGLCRVKVISGGEALSPVDAIDKKHIGNVYFITKVRLSCQARVQEGDVVVEIPGFRLADPSKR